MNRTELIQILSKNIRSSIIPYLKDNKELFDFPADVVTHSSVLNWMRNPNTLDEVLVSLAEACVFNSAISTDTLTSTREDLVEGHWTDNPINTFVENDYYHSILHFQGYQCYSKVSIVKGLRWGRCTLYWDNLETTRKSLHEDGSYSASEKYKERWVLSEGNYENDKKVGEWLTFSGTIVSTENTVIISEEVENGVVISLKRGSVSSIDHFVNDEYHGVHYSFQTNGELMESGFYNNGKKEGTWLYFSAQNEIYFREKYNQGEWIEQIFFHPNGNVKVKMDFKNDEIHGMLVEFYSDNSVKIKGKYHEGKKNGKWEYFNEFGTIISEEYYDDEGQLYKKLNFDYESKTMIEVELKNQNSADDFSFF